MSLLPNVTIRTRVVKLLLVVIFQYGYLCTCTIEDFWFSNGPPKTLRYLKIFFSIPNAKKSTQIEGPLHNVRTAVLNYIANILSFFMIFIIIIIIIICLAMTKVASHGVQTARGDHYGASTAESFSALFPACRRLNQPGQRPGPSFPLSICRFLPPISCQDPHSN